MENFANQGGMITEQVWDGDDLPHARMKCGCPRGAATKNPSPAMKMSER
jgi:hypothetical protein